MSMFPSDAIQVIENSAAKVVILDPPAYAFGVWILFLATCTLAGAIALLVNDLGVGFAAIPVVIALSLAAFGSYLATSKTVYTLSKQDSLLRTQNYRWGMKSKETALRLADIRRVIVETIQYSHILTIVLNSGENFNLGNGSNRQGYFGAADAINDFLGVPRER
jgi:hypothetical protein